MGGQKTGQDKHCFNRPVHLNQLMALIFLEKKNLQRETQPNYNSEYPII